MKETEAVGSRIPFCLCPGLASILPDIVKIGLRLMEQRQKARPCSGPIAEPESCRGGLLWVGPWMSEKQEREGPWVKKWRRRKGKRGNKHFQCQSVSRWLGNAINSRTQIMESGHPAADNFNHLPDQGLVSDQHPLLTCPAICWFWKGWVGLGWVISSHLKWRSLDF
jgi:hypothetical protein